MIGVYIRVSTAGQNVSSQKREIQRWLDGNGHSHVRWFVDKATGTNLERPAFEELQKAIFNGEITTIVVWKLDRLSRDLREGLNVLVDWCERGLRVVSTTQMIDFNGAMGKLVAAVLLGVAEMEQEIRKERQMAGIAAAKADGVYLGRRRGSYKAKPQRVSELKERGLSDTEIANSMNISRRTVQRYMKLTDSK